MKEKEFEQYSSRLKNRLMIFLFIFYGAFCFIQDMYDQFNYTTVVIMISSVVTLGCALYYIEKLMKIALVEKTEN